MDKRIFLIPCAVAVFSLAHSSAEARHRQRTIRCESRDGDYAYCQTNTTGYVELRRQLSRRPCEEYDTWGVTGDGSGIWVRDGCRAEFAVSERRGWGRWRRDRDDRDDRDDRYGRAETTQIRCASENWNYQHCRVRGGAREGRIVRQISNTRCERGDNWGLDRGGIWVDRGCEAVFEVR